MSEDKKFVNVALNAYGETTTYTCALENVKQGDFVIVPTLSGQSTGRVMSYSPKKVFSLSLAKTRAVVRKATPEEINEVADLFGIKKNPDLATDEEDESFLTNSGYGTKELQRMMKKLQAKQETTQASTESAKDADVNNDANTETKTEGLSAEAKTVTETAKNTSKTNGVIKDDTSIPDYWRYVAMGILALYFLKDYIFG